MKHKTQLLKLADWRYDIAYMTTLIQKINNSFTQARKMTLLDFVYLLLRVSPIESYKHEPLAVLYKETDEQKRLNANFIVKLYENRDFWGLLINLSRICSKYAYNPYPFWAIEPHTSCFDETLKYTRFDISREIKKIFPDDPSRATRRQMKEIRNFLLNVLERYFIEKKRFINKRKLYNTSNFEVLELLTNDEEGLYGFKMYFSNGSNAEYKRLSNYTETINLTLSPAGVSYFVGRIDYLKKEWYVGDKRLCEMGLDGKYNKIGEWKPLTFPGDSEELKREAYECSEDDKVRGAMFYILCTCHKVVEFAVRADLDIPTTGIKFLNGVMLAKVKNKSQLTAQHVYDGWIQVEKLAVTDIENAFQKIQQTINSLALTYDCSIKWTPKYFMTSTSDSVAHLKKKDVKLLDQTLGALDTYKEPLFNSAQDWFSKGVNSNNPFTAFLCFHTAMEGLAIKLVEGALPTSEKFSFSKKKSNEINKCIQKYFEMYYAKDPKKFVQSAFYDCVKSIGNNLRIALESVFGPNSNIPRNYMEGKNSLWDIRGRLAHGDYTETKNEDIKLIRSNLYKIRGISREFFIRVLLGLSPNEKLPAWSRSFSITTLMDDPRGCLIATHLNFFPRKDWTIRAEWID